MRRSRGARITANGYGEERPVVEPERNERDRARNRRVETRILSGP